MKHLKVEKRNHLCDFCINNKDCKHKHKYKAHKCKDFNDGEKIHMTDMTAKDLDDERYANK